MNSIDFKDEAAVKDYIDRLGVEFRFQCFSEERSDGCHRLADWLEFAKKDHHKAGRVFKSNCDLHGYAHSCFKYGNYAFLGRGIPEPIIQDAAEYYRKGCNAAEPYAAVSFWCKIAPICSVFVFTFFYHVFFFPKIYKFPPFCHIRHAWIMERWSKRGNIKSKTLWNHGRISPEDAIWKTEPLVIRQQPLASKKENFKILRWLSSSLQKVGSLFQFIAYPPFCFTLSFTVFRLRFGWLQKLRQCGFDVRTGRRRWKEREIGSDVQRQSSVHYE